MRKKAFEQRQGQVGERIGSQNCSKSQGLNTSNNVQGERINPAKKDNNVNTSVLCTSPKSPLQNTSVSNLVTQVDVDILSSQLRVAPPNVDPSKYIKTDLCSMYMAINIKIEPATKVDESDGKEVLIRYDQGCTAFYKDKLFNGLKDCVCSEKFPFHIVDTHNYLKFCTKEYIAKNRVKSAFSKNRQRKM